MKKILSLFALVMLSCMGAWAQTVAEEPTQSVEDGHYYVFQTHNQLGAYTSYYLYDNGGVVNAAEKAENIDLSYVWKMVKDGERYAVLNVGTQRYISIPNNANGWAIPTVTEKTSTTTFQIKNDGVNLLNNTAATPRYVDCGYNGNGVVSWSGDGTSSKLLKMFEVTDVNVAQITFNVKNGNEVVYSSKFATAQNSTWTAPQAPDFITYTTNSFVVGNEDSYTFETTYTSSFPFAEGKTYTMKASNGDNFVFTGTHAYKAGTDALYEGNDWWQFERVANTMNLFKVKNVKAGYAKVAGAGNQTLVTFTESATEWTSGTGATSYFRIVKNGDGFDLQHPGDPKANAGNHVEGKLGLWNHNNSAGDGGSRIFVAEVTLDGLKTSTVAYVSNVASKLTALYTESDKIAAIEAINGASSFQAVLDAANAFYALADGKNVSFKSVARRTTTGSYLAASEGSLSTEAEFGYNSVWNLQHVKGATYRLYNAQTNLYVGVMPATDSQPIPTTKEQASAGAYELTVTNIENLVNIKYENSRVREHIHENGSNNPVVWAAGSQATEASCWTLELVNLGDLVALDAHNLLVENASAHSANPALGQYPDVAYNELNNAYTIYQGNKNADNLAALQQAMKTFNNSVVKAVYVIENMQPSYGIGKAIVNDNNDGQPHFTLIDKCDDRMLWVVNTKVQDMVPGTYTIANLHTGKALWGDGTIDVTETSDETQVEGQFLIKQGGNVRHAQESGSWLVTWNPTTTANSGSAWKFHYVGTDVELSAFTEKFEQYHVLTAAEQGAKAAISNRTFGAQLGQYSGTTDDEINEKISAAKALSAGMTIDQVDIEAIVDASAAIDAEVAKIQINIPNAGTFLRIKGHTSNKYISGNGTSGQAVLVDAADANSILYYTADNELIGYVNGRGFTGTHSVAGIGVFEKHTFAEAAFAKGKYIIKSNYSGSKVLCDWTDGKLNRWGNENDSRSTWSVEAVESLPVSVSDAGYATFHAPVALTIPDGVEAYTLTLEGNYLKAAAVEGIIPANTPVVLKAEENTYSFEITEGGEAGDNDLTGTIAAITKPENALVLGMDEEKGVGFYSLKDEVTTLAGFKAYYLATAGESNLRIAFDNELLTSILSAAQQNGGQAIYDLQGRRVLNAKGISIQAGKKVIK